MLNLMLRYGNEKSLAGQIMAANLLGDMLPRGTEKHTRQQLQDELDKLGARVNIGSGTSYVSVNSRSSARICQRCSRC